MNKRIRKKQARKYGNRCPRCGSGDVAGWRALLPKGGRWKAGPYAVVCFTCDPARNWYRKNLESDILDQG